MTFVNGGSDRGRPFAEGFAVIWIILGVAALVVWAAAWILLAGSRRRKKQQRAEEWLDACQAADENHPGLYEEMIQEAKRALVESQRSQVQGSNWWDIWK